MDKQSSSQRRYGPIGGERTRQDKPDIDGAAVGSVATFAEGRLMRIQAPPIDGLLETALYVDDMARSVAFFADVLGLRALIASERLTAFDLGSQGVLLVFARGLSVADMPSPIGTIPGHDGNGPLHMAFKISANAYDAWLAHLERASVRIVSEVRWPRGGKSLYFHDPDGHVLETCYARAMGKLLALRPNFDASWSARARANAG